MKAGFLLPLTSIALLFSPLAAPAESGDSPDELNQKAYSLSREALRAQSKKNDSLAYEKLSAARDLYAEIARNFPDYKYRGSKYNFACKHIWAVILKERLLK